MMPSIVSGYELLPEGCKTGLFSESVAHQTI